MQNRRLIINSIYYTIGEILPRIAGFFLLPLLTRYLTPAEYGIFSYTNTVMVFAFALSTLSLNTFLLRNYYKEETQQDRQRIVGNIFVLMLIANAGVSLLEILVFPGALAGLKIGIPFRPFFLLAIVNNFMEGISVVPLIIFRIRQNARVFVLINAVRVFLQLLVTALLLTRWHFGLLGVYWARILVGIPFTLIFLGVVYRHAIFRPDPAQMRKALRFSMPLLPGVLFYLFIASFDRVVLEKNVGLELLGLYSTAATLALALNIVVQGLYRAFEPNIFAKHGQPGYQQMTDELYRYFLACLLGAGFLVSIFSREIFLFFTSPRFLPAHLFVPLLVAPVVLNGLITFLTVLVVAEQRQTVITRGMFLSLVVTLPATLGLIRVWGVYGAIVSSVLSFGIVVFFYLHQLRLKQSYVLTWGGLLLLLMAICQGVQLLDLPIVAMIGIKLGLSLGYLALCVYCFRLRLRAAMPYSSSC
jgi:O-antigen/teichoic acid export membrane protein